MNRHGTALYTHVPGLQAAAAAAGHSLAGSFRFTPRRSEKARPPGEQANNNDQNNHGARPLTQNPGPSI